MASTSRAISTSSVLLITLFFFLLVPPSPSQCQAQSPPMISVCGPLFIPLAVCAPFVQGTAQAPGQSCCDNLNRLYGQQPECLCLVLGDNIISNVFPISRTLALKLPSLCSLERNTSTCSGPNPSPGPSADAKSPSSQISVRTKDNSTSTVAASPSPTASEMPKGHHNVLGLGIMRSDCQKSTRSNTHIVNLALLVTTVSALFTQLIPQN